MNFLLRWFNFLPLWRVGRIKLWGAHVLPPTFDRWLCLVLHRVGLMGRTDHAFLSAHLRPSWTVVDIGANQGLYTLLFSQLVGPGGRVLAFEPDDMLHRALLENVAWNAARNVTAYHLALGSAAGTMTLYRSLLNSGDNRLAAGSSRDGPREAIQIQVARLDEVLVGEHVDFIKMDVQGWEMEAFRGMERLLDAPGNESLTFYFEYWPQGLNNAGSDPLEPLVFLSARGFDLFQMRSGTPSAIRDLEVFARSADQAKYINLFAARARPAAE